MAEGSDTKNNKIPPAEDTPQERPPFATAAMFLGTGAALIGLLGIIGMFLGISVFTSFFLGYKTIALSASVIWIIFGCVLTYHAATPLRGRMRTFVAAVVALVSIFAALEFFFAIRGEHFIVETWSVQAGRGHLRHAFITHIPGCSGACHSHRNRIVLPAVRVWSFR